MDKRLQDILDKYKDKIDIGHWEVFKEIVKGVRDLEDERTELKLEISDLNIKLDLRDVNKLSLYGRIMFLLGKN